MSFKVRSFQVCETEISMPLLFKYSMTWTSAFHGDMLGDFNTHVWVIVSGAELV